MSGTFVVRIWGLFGFLGLWVNLFGVYKGGFSFVLSSMYGLFCVSWVGIGFVYDDPCIINE